MLARFLCVCRDRKEWTGVLQPFAPGGQPLDPDNLGRMLAAFTPEGAIVGNEAATTGLVRALAGHGPSLIEALLA